MLDTQLSGSHHFAVKERPSSAQAYVGPWPYRCDSFFWGSKFMTLGQPSTAADLAAQVSVAQASTEHICWPGPGWGGMCSAEAGKLGNGQSIALGKPKA